MNERNYGRRDTDQKEESDNTENDSLDVDVDVALFQFPSLPPSSHFEREEERGEGEEQRASSLNLEDPVAFERTVTEAIAALREPVSLAPEETIEDYIERSLQYQIATIMSGLLPTVCCFLSTFKTIQLTISTT